MMYSYDHFALHGIHPLTTWQTSLHVNALHTQYWDGSRRRSEADKDGNTRYSEG